MKKRKKRIFAIVLCVVVGLFIVNFGFKITLANINYAHNIQLEVPTQNGLIINQKACNQFKFGVRPANKVACGAIATYNFLTLNGKKANFYKILRYYDIFGSIVYGVFGINPFQIQRYLLMQGLDVRMTINKELMPELTRKSGTSILFYWHKSGAHFITYQYDNQNNSYIAYNLIYGKVITKPIPELLASKPNNGGLAVLFYLGS